MSENTDYFSGTASGYATARPHYPDAIADWLASVAPGRARAWDCGTGSGQAARGLARHFAEVVATDSSEAQLRHAVRLPAVHYAAMRAEQPALPTGSVNLVTVAQALHWLDLTPFYAEVNRVLTDGGVLAVWTYGLIEVDPALDVDIRHFYSAEVGRYWPAERALVDAGYAGIAFPFDELEVPRFTMEAHWTLAHFSAYLETWSAVTRFRRAHGHSPVARFIDTLADRWGLPGAVRRVAWPLELRAGRKHK